MRATLNATCQSAHTLHTIGHSTRSLEAHIELLHLHSTAILIDVRRWPASRRLPHFNRAALAAALQLEGIDYLWRGDLGGFRKASPDSPNTGWRVAAFRAYADFMLQEEFARIMKEMEIIAGERRAARHVRRSGTVALSSPVIGRRVSRTRMECSSYSGRCLP